ncbi:unnamed protein product [Urochloa humidicola]
MHSLMNQKVQDDKAIGVDTTEEVPVGQCSQESVILSPEKSKDISVIPEGKVLVHSIEGTYWMDKDKWPMLKLPEDKTHQEEDLMDNTSNYSLEVITEEEDNQGWEQAANKKKRLKSIKTRKKPAVASRSSARVVRDGVPIALKAMARTRNRNELQKGINDNHFTILNNAPDDHIAQVISDLDISVPNIDTQINIFRAEELVRADLALANYKKYLDKINSRNAPQSEGDLSELAMEAISNSVRLRGDESRCSGNIPDAEGRAEGTQDGVNNDSTELEC